jgi:hypothetical protein
VRAQNWRALLVEVDPGICARHDVKDIVAKIGQEERLRAAWPRMPQLASCHSADMPILRNALDTFMRRNRLSQDILRRSRIGAPRIDVLPDGSDVWGSRICGIYCRTSVAQLDKLDIDRIIRGPKADIARNIEENLTLAWYLRNDNLQHIIVLRGMRIGIRSLSRKHITALFMMD